MTTEPKKDEDPRAVPEIGIHAPDILHIGSRAALRVLLQAAHGPRDAAPLAGARLTAVLEPRHAARRRVGEAVTDPDGIAVLNVIVPDVGPGRCWLTIRAETVHGPAELRHEVEVRADARLIAAPDARTVPAGGEARVRFVVLRAQSLAPIPGAAIEVSATDSRGNRLATRILTTDAAGGAELRLPIAPGARPGRWTVAAAFGECEARCAFRVGGSECAAPQADSALCAAFFPAGGGLVPEIERDLFVHLSAPGRIELALVGPGTLPEIRLGPDGGIPTDGEGWARLAVRVPADYLTPAFAGAEEVEYAARGFRDERLIQPATVTVRFRARSGDATAVGEASIDAFRLEAPLTLTLEREIANAGEALPIAVRSGAEEGTVFVDLVQGAQVVQVRTLTLKGGCAFGSIDLPADASGLLEVRAYRALPFGRLVEDVRLMVARPRAGLVVDLDGVGRVRVQDRTGVPVVASVDLTFAPLPQTAVPERWIDRVLELRGRAALVPTEKFPGFTPVLRALALDDGASGAPAIGLSAYLARCPAHSRYGWSVDPAAERRRGLISQLLRVFSNLVAYLERHPFACPDPVTGAWGYVPDLMERIVREGRLLREDLVDFSGRAYEMKDLEALDPLFSFPFLSRAVTGVRIRRVYEALAEYGRRHERWSWIRRAAWEFPPDVAAQLVSDGLLEAESLRDAWGHVFEIRRRETPEERPGLQNGLGLVHVVSGGPDGVFTEGVDPDQPLLSVHEMRATAVGPTPDAAIPAAPARRSTWPASRLHSGAEEEEWVEGFARADLPDAPTRAWTLETDAARGEADAAIPPGCGGLLVAVARSADGAVGVAVREIPVREAPSPPPATPAAEWAAAPLALGMLLRPGRALSVPMPAPAPAELRVRRIAGPLALLRSTWEAVHRTEVRDLDDALVAAVSAAHAAHAGVEEAKPACAIAWQEILARECPDGGFSSFGRGPGHPAQAARVLLAIADLKRVTEIDPRVIDRVVAALQGTQERDGSWGLDRAAGGWDALTQRFVPTAYVLGALAGAGVHGAVADQAAAYLRRRLRDAQHDPYALAVALWALLAHLPGDTTMSRECERLEVLARAENGEEAAEMSWSPVGATLFGTWGADARVEATALALLALQRAPVPHPRAAGGILYLLRMRGADGTWGAPHVTETVLRVLANASRWPASASGATPVVRVNGVEHELPPAGDGDPEVRELLWPLAPGERLEVLVVSGAGLPFQILLPGAGDPKLQIATALRCARKTVAVGESFELEIGLDHGGGFPVWRSVVEIALPAGVAPDRALLDRWVEEGILLAWSPTRTGLRLDSGTLRPKEKRLWKLALAASSPGKITLGPARARERYGPSFWASASAVELEVV